MTGLHVALVHWSFAPTTGGVESHLFDIARLLRRLHCRVTVVTGEPDAVRSSHYDIVATPLLNLQHIRVSGDTFVPGLREFFTDLIRTRAIDVVHGHNLHHFSSGPAVVLHALRKDLGFRMHHTFHETWPDVLHAMTMYTEWDGNYAVSQFIGAQCLDLLGVRTRVLPLGIDIDRFVPRSHPHKRERLVILHPARLLPWKGVHVSVHMLARLRDQRHPVVLVLTDTQRIVDWNVELTEYRQHIIDMIAGLGLQDSVRFEAVDYDGMPALYDAADVVVYPTVGDEPHGLVPLEAMACGLPIVATRSGGIAETVLDAKTGFIVARNDVEALTARVSMLLKDASLRSEMGAAGRHHVCERFSLSRYASTLRQLYMA